MLCSIWCWTYAFNQNISVRCSGIEMHVVYLEISECKIKLYPLLAGKVTVNLRKQVHVWNKLQTLFQVDLMPISWGIACYSRHQFHYISHQHWPYARDCRVFIPTTVIIPNASDWYPWQPCPRQHWTITRTVRKRMSKSAPRLLESRR